MPDTFWLRKGKVCDRFEGHFRFRSDMNEPHTAWSVSALVLASVGFAIAAAGLYFIFLRPPLLPEDIRYMSLSSAQLGVVRLPLEAWLTQVFRVLGGYILATGVLTMTVAATSFRAHNRGAALGASVGGAASIGLMATVNFVIDSDFKWVLLVIAFAWASSLVLFWFETRMRRGSKT